MPANRNLFHTHLIAMALLCVFACALSGYACGSQATWRWDNVRRVVVVADVHGAYAELTGLLEAAGLINKEQQWTGGDTHLVSLGDLLDRGDGSRQVMDLLIRLQREAALQSGFVHVVAGNHEIMNLMGDLRYVSPAEFAAFSDLESTAERQQAYSEFLAGRNESIAFGFLRGGVPDIQDDREAREEFDRLYPIGYFGHLRAFSPGGYYAEWLAERPALIVINDTVYVHGGLPEMAARESLEALNRRFHADIRRYMQLWEELVDVGILSKTSPDSAHQRAVQALRIADPSSCSREERRECQRERGAARDEQREPAPATLNDLHEFVDLGRTSMLGIDGPLWYRGSVRCKDILEQPVLDRALSNLGADQVVVGHTPTVDRLVHRIRDGRLIMLDTGMLVSHYRGRPAALVSEAGSLQVQYLNPLERGTPVENGGTGVYAFSDEELGEALLTAAIVDQQTSLFDEFSSVTLLYRGQEILANFLPEDGSGKAEMELAAYALDSMLGFDIVPITVVRRIDGRPGALQLRYPNEISESARLRKGYAIGGWCPVEPQFELKRVFDALVHNTDSSGRNLFYDMDHWGLYARGYGAAFGVSRELYRAYSGRALELTPAIAASLASLDRDSLRSALGQGLEPAQIDALLARRDALLELAAPVR